MSSIPVRPTSRQAIWKTVREPRTLLGVENDLYFNIINFVEKVLPLFLPNFVFEICSEEEMGDLHGETFPGECIRIMFFTNIVNIMPIMK